MTLSATAGPMATLYQSSPANQNPQEGPSPLAYGTLLQDPRTVYAYQPGASNTRPVYGWQESLGVCLDQVPSAIADNNIAASQTPGAAVRTITLVSSSGAGITVGQSITRADTGATVTGLLAIDTAMAGVGFGQDATVNIWSPTRSIARAVRITSGGNDSGITFTVNGYDIYYYPMTETITGASIGIATGKKAFKYISSITCSGDVAGTVKVGTSDIFGFPLRVDRQPYARVWWDNQEMNGTGTSAREVISIPIQNSDLVNSQQWAQAVPFNFSVVSIDYYTGKAVTTSGKAATLTAQVNGSNVAGGGVVSLTSLAMTPTGTKVAGTAITGTNTGTAGQTVGFAVSGVTAFTEGDGFVEIIVINTDLAGGTFVAADTTTATATTGDVRGTITTPSASDGTRRLFMQIQIPAANLSSSSGIVGVTQA